MKRALHNCSTTEIIGPQSLCPPVGTGRQAHLLHNCSKCACQPKPGEPQCIVSQGVRGFLQVGIRNATYVRWYEEWKRTPSVGDAAVPRVDRPITTAFPWNGRGGS